MYICICNAIRVSELRSAALVHSGDAESIYTALGRPPQCRNCIEEADAIVEEARCDRRLPVCVTH